MMTIHKYQFEINDIVVVRMPEGSHILKVECQRGVPCIWAIVDTSKPRTEYYFRIFGTGHSLTPNARADTHVATFQDGSLVWHMFKEQQ